MRTERTETRVCDMREQMREREERTGTRTFEHLAGALLELLVKDKALAQIGHQRAPHLRNAGRLVTRGRS